MHGFLHNGLFVLAALGPAASSVFLVVIIGRLFVILLDGFLVVPVFAVGVALLLLTIALVFVIVFVLPLQFVDLLDDGSVLGLRHHDAVAILGALDLHLGEDSMLTDEGPFAGLEDCVVLRAGGLVDDSPYIVYGVPSLLCELLARTRLMDWFYSFFRIYTIRLRNWLRFISFRAILIFIFYF